MVLTALAVCPILSVAVASIVREVTLRGTESHDTGATAGAAVYSPDELVHSNIVDSLCGKSNLAPLKSPLPHPRARLLIPLVEYQ